MPTPSPPPPRRHRPMDEPEPNPRSYKRRKHQSDETPPKDAEIESDSDSPRPETPPTNFQDDEPIASTEATSVTAASSSSVKSLQPRNAFSELMSKKPKKVEQLKKPPPRGVQYYLNRNDPRSGLASYLVDPSAHPKSTVLFYNDDFVVIKDMYPKATVHALVLPRDIAVTHAQPLEVLTARPDLLASLREITARFRTVLAKELQRTHSSTSSTELIRRKAEEALEKRALTDPDGFDPDSEEAQATLPPHRDWESLIRVGVHSRPSMSNLHVHIISEDMHSPSVKKRVHFNSFNTKFFVNLDEFPLDEDDFRLPGKGTTKGLLESDMLCWRCGRNFKNKFTALKAHLEEEYDEWKRI